MSRQLIKTLIVAFSFLVWSHSGLAVTDSDSQLAQIQRKVALTLKIAANPSLDLLQRLQSIHREKTLAESSIRQQILDGQANADDLNNPSSPLSMALKGVDALTVLTELKVDVNTGVVTAESCGRARSLMAVSNLTAQGESLTLSKLDTQIQDILNQICRK